MNNKKTKKIIEKLELVCCMLSSAIIQEKENPDSIFDPIKSHTFQLEVGYVLSIIYDLKKQIEKDSKIKGCL